MVKVYNIFAKNIKSLLKALYQERSLSMRFGKKVLRKAAVALLVSAIITLMCPVCVMAAGNTYQTATSVTLGSTVYGTLTDSNTVDFYQFTLSNSGHVAIKTQAQIEWVYFALYYGQEAEEQIFDFNPKWDTVSEVSNNTYEYDLTAGTYYFRVKRDGSRNGTYNFKVTYTNSNESFKESSSNNNSMAKANSISLNTKYNGFIAKNDNVDWFKFTLPADDTVKVSLSAYIEWVYLYVYNSDGVRVFEKNPRWDSVAGMSNNTYSIELSKGTYYLVVNRDGFYSGAYNFTVSSDAVPTLAITTQPKTVSALEGSTAKFTIGVNGTGIKYQWQTNKDGTWVNSSLPGYNSPTLSVPAIQARNGYKFRCIVTDSYKNRVVSNAVSLNVVKILISSQPKDYSGYPGGTATFSVTAQGSGLKYQWQTNSSGTWVNSSLPGSKTSKLSVPVTQARNGYKFRCVITDSKNNVVYSNVASMKVLTPEALVITSNPSNFVGPVGARASFKVVAKGTGLKYQWQTYKNGAWVNSSMTGYNTPTLVVDVLKSRNGYNFRCVVTDYSGKKVISGKAILRVST